MAHPEPILCEELSAHDPRMQHGFFTRAGGESTGIYEGLNVGLGSGDDLETVRRNRARVAQHFDRSYLSLATPHQVHSAEAMIVTEPLGLPKPKVDAFVTNNPDMVIGVLSADCGPVLFADREHQVIAAAHSGWPGATTGILENTLATMEKLHAEDAGVVPCDTLRRLAADGGRFIDVQAGS